MSTKCEHNIPRMEIRIKRYWPLSLLIFFLGWAQLLAAEPDKVNFQRDIRPLLADRCFQCHGPDEKARQADLRLDQMHSAQAAIKADSSVGDSPLLQRILSTDPDQIMPPPEVNKPLTPREKELLRSWILEGAKWQQHWSYEPPQRWSVPSISELPATDAAASISQSQGNWVDQFVLQAIQKAGISTSPPADRTTLLRRLCFDLTGLPPRPELVKRWSLSQLDYPQLVEELLISPQYGERMAMYWLDLVRYADTVGYHGDQDHSISAYRDWVIDAFINGKPFDQMTIEQLAGDLLPNPSLEQKIATGYNRLLQTTHEGGLQPKEYRTIYAADRVRNVSAVWLAATVGCSQCHDHKFDPFTMKDFYSLSAFFADVDDETHFTTGSNDLPTRRDPEIELPTAEQRRTISELEAKIQQLQKQTSEQATAEKVAKEKAEEGKQEKPTAERSAALEELKKQLAQAKKSVRRSMITVALKEPRATRILPRGNWLDESGDLVMPNYPEFMATSQQEGLSVAVSQSVTKTDQQTQLPQAKNRLTRLDLARWLVDPKQGVGLLTARVMVNRIWYLFFGQGLSRSLDDFGSQGEAPSHPELLDNLAHHLVDSGWDLRSTIRLIVLSRTYQQSSVVSSQMIEQDAGNIWLGRQNAYRLPAEMIRDNALAVSGLLVEKVGGESSRPYQPAGYYKHLNFPEREYKPDQSESQWRRGLYVHWQRQFLHPTFRALDATNREECTAQRPRSNTPLAALALLNDPSFVEAARLLAESLLTESDESLDHTDAARLSRLFHRVTTRAADEAEQDVLMALLNKNRRVYLANRSAAKELLSVGLRPANSQLDAVALAAWAEVCRAMFNLAETNMRN